MPTRYHWAHRGDINAFFGLILDNVAVMSLLLVMIASAEPGDLSHFSREFVFRQWIPGTAQACSLAISFTPGWPFAWPAAPGGKRHRHAARARHAQHVRVAC